MMLWLRSRIGEKRVSIQDQSLLVRASHDTLTMSLTFSKRIPALFLPLVS
jgi:hypothetical protein